MIMLINAAALIISISPPQTGAISLRHTVYQITQTKKLIGLVSNHYDNTTMWYVKRKGVNSRPTVFVCLGVLEKF